MSRHATWPLRTIGLGVALLIAGPLEAQTTEAAAREQALVRRLEELTPRFLAAEEAAKRAAELIEGDRPGLRQDTVMVGPLRIVTTADQVDDAARLWAEQWALFEPILGEQTASLSLTTFIHHYRPERFRYDVSAAYVPTVDVRTPGDEGRLKAVIHQVIGVAAARALPYEIATWQGGTALDARTISTRMYRLFVSNPTAIAQSCAQGSNDACWTAFGDMDESLDPIATWYKPAEQRALLLTDPGANAIEREACLDGAIRACHEMLEDALTGQGHMPYPSILRASLLWFALREGGPGAVDRLAASVEPSRSRVRGPGRASLLLGPITDIRTHLERASGLDGDVLIGRWRESILAGRPAPPATDERTRASTMLWIMLFAGLATRSKRWRLG
jgi:hypothetical protein